MGKHVHLYNSTRWKRRRKLQLEEFPLCTFCLDVGQTKPAKVADHIIPHRGDEQLFYYGDLQSLCWSCHSGAKQKQELTGILIGGNEQGYPADPNHIWNRRK